MTNNWKVAVDNLLAEWYAVKDDEDLRKTNAFLWQRPQDMLEMIECMNIALKHYVEKVDELKTTLEKREVALKYYDSIIEEQEEMIDIFKTKIIELTQDKKALRNLISPEVINTGVDEKYSGA